MTSEYWKSENSTKLDKNCFLFSLDKNKIYPPKKIFIINLPIIHMMVLVLVLKIFIVSIYVKIILKIIHLKILKNIIKIILIEMKKYYLKMGDIKVFLLNNFFNILKENIIYSKNYLIYHGYFIVLLFLTED